MRRHHHSSRLVLATGDAVAAAAAYGTAYVVRFGSGWIPVEGRADVLPSRYLAALPAVVAIALAATALVGAYDPVRVERSGRLRTAVAAAIATGALLGSAALLYRDVFQFSRLALLGTAAAYLPCMLAGRGLSARLLDRRHRSGRGMRRALVIGGGAAAAALARELARAPWIGTAVVAVSGDAEAAQHWPAAQRVAGDDVDALLERGACDDVLIALPAAGVPALGDVVARLGRHPVSVHVIPDLGDMVLVNAHATLVGGLPLISLNDSPLYGLRAAAKRALDVLLAAVCLLVAAPLLAVIALLVRVGSPGPVLYAQERMGLDGRCFRMWKFRTMRADAEDETGPVFARRGDPRVTAVGRLLRRFSLDELPQLWNVLRGEMSLVGPRPERQAFIHDLRKSLPGYMLRHCVRAGMTGWAQVHGLRGDTPLAERLRYDLEYVDRWSLLLDVEILARTTVHVLVGRNAY